VQFRKSVKGIRTTKKMAAQVTTPASEPPKPVTAAF
jgi:hypothetical protein